LGCRQLHVRHVPLLCFRARARRSSSSPEPISSVLVSHRAHRELLGRTRVVPWSSSSVRVALSCPAHQISCANLAQAYSLGHLSDQVTTPSTVQRRSAHANWCSHASATPTPSTARPPAHASKIMPLVPRTPTHATTSRQPNYTMQLMITDPRLLDQAKGPRLLELTLRPTLHAPRQKTKTQPAAPHVNASNFRPI
jgi:hypothetical protein